MTTYLRNVWYVAAWDHEVPADRPLARTILGERLVFFRDADGRPQALFDRCPHRFAPLSMGKVVDGCIQCPYHGLQFGGDGACTRNPHGSGLIPKAAQVRSYPVVERWSVLWIWIGDAAQADPELIPNFRSMDPESR